jgi:hypothetical protein
MQRLKEGVNPFVQRICFADRMSACLAQYYITFIFHRQTLPFSGSTPIIVMD